MTVQNSDCSDIDFTLELFNAAVAYQRKKGYNLWPQFSRELIEREVAEKRHWKITEGNDIACVFSVQYDDPVIWGEKDKDAVYLHRIAVNPLFKGKKLMELIRSWATAHAKQLNKKYLRMDTWGDNVILRKYYIACGFNYIGQQQLTNTKGLPAHYGGDLLSLFEIEIT